jgi:hypothetical protein
MRANAVSLFGRLQDASPATLSTLMRSFLDRDHRNVSAAATEALVLLGASAARSEVIDPFVQILQSPHADRQLQKQAMEVLGAMGAAAAIPSAIGALASFDQEGTPADLAQEARGALARIRGSAVGERTRAGPCMARHLPGTGSSASGQQPLGGRQPESVSGAERSIAAESEDRERTVRDEQSLEHLRAALNDPDWRVSNSAGWQLLKLAWAPDILAEAVEKLVFQWGYVFDERLTAGSTIGSLGELARRRPEILPEVVPKIGAAMEVVMSALGIAEVSAAAAEAIMELTARGLRLFRLGQATWQAIRVEDLPR